jgi:DNA-3-methyladenine glycosylase II
LIGEEGIQGVAKMKLAKDMRRHRSLAIVKGMRRIDSVVDIEEAVAALIAMEPRFGAIAGKGLPPLRRVPEGFATLIEIIAEQMLSLKASQAIMKRLRSALDPFDAAEIHRCPAERLQKLGLSRAKARAVQAIAQAVVEGRLDFNELEQLGDDEARMRLMALPGVGPWSADIYLLTALGRRDVWPTGDVALQSAAQLLFNLDSRPDRRSMEKLAEAWRPWRAVAARLLWSHYRRVKAMAEGVDERPRPLHSIVTQDIVIKATRGAGRPEG